MFQDQGLKRGSFPGTVGLEGSWGCLLSNYQISTSSEKGLLCAWQSLLCLRNDWGVRGVRAGVPSSAVLPFCWCSCMGLLAGQAGCRSGARDGSGSHVVGGLCFTEPLQFWFLREQLRAIHS